MISKFFKYFLTGLFIFNSSTAFANIVISVAFTAKNNDGKFIGNVIAKQTSYGVLFIPNLYGLPPKPHGFHIHTNPSCKNDGMAAGGHLDPQNTGKHLGPYENGHLGDLPILVVNQDGSATLPVLAPRLTLGDLKNHALMIHEGGDNYSDIPEKLGGGGNRMICGVIK